MSDKVDIDNIRYSFEAQELFQRQVEEAVNTLINKNNTSNLTIVYDEVEYNIKVKKSQTILDCSIENNLDVPYSCQGGVCSSCIAKLKKGKIEMLENQILTDEEIKDGLVLTCQSIAASDNIIIDYDEV